LKTARAQGHESSVARGAARAAEDDHDLFTRWRRHHDAEAREALLLRYMPLARSLARRYGGSHESFEDLRQVASLGLVNALDRFDPARGPAFASFAVPTILGELRRFFRDSTWGLHVTRREQERALQIRDARGRLANERGRTPTVNELAEYLEMSVEEVLSGVLALEAFEPASLDAPVAHRDDGSVAYGDLAGKEDERYELIELDATVSAALEQIPVRDRRILFMRFVEDLTQAEIARRTGISQMQVSRVLRRSLAELQALTTTSEITAAHQRRTRRGLRRQRRRADKRA
jgi:RNA polymerase sigma-B factor